MGGGFSLREPLINSKNIEKLFRINLSSSVEINSKIIKKVLNKKNPIVLFILEVQHRLRQ